MPLKKASLCYCIFILFVLVYLTGCALMALREPAPPLEILIDNHGYEEKQKGPVGFGHIEHIEEYQVACVQCHHVYQEGNNVWAKGDPVGNCAECHNPLDEEGIQLNRLKTAYHKQCCLCHIEINKQGGTAPFEKCEECHGNQ